MVIMTPADEIEARAMLTTGFLHDGPSAVRYPRGSATGKLPAKTLSAIDFGKAQVCRQGEKVALLVFGPLLKTARKVADELNATLINMRFVKPLDEATIKQIAESHELIVTLEENAIAGGAGSAVSEYLDAASININTLHLGFPDKYVEQGTQQEMLADWGLDETGIRDSILARLNQQLPI
jgi:1-deoxy-D-xylulose-5-phosphate synthase